MVTCGIPLPLTPSATRSIIVAAVSGSPPTQLLRGDNYTTPPCICGYPWRAVGMVRIVNRKLQQVLIFCRRISLSLCVCALACVCSSACPCWPTPDLKVLHNLACVEAVKTGSVGLGQLFRSLDILPNFELLNAGHWSGSTAAFEGNSNDCGNGMGVEGRGRGKGGLWRVYDLRSRHLSCRIHEEFLPDLFDINSNDNNRV